MRARRDEDVPARDRHDVQEGEDERRAEDEVCCGVGGCGGEGVGGLRGWCACRGGGGGEGRRVGVGDGAEGAGG